MGQIVIQIGNDNTQGGDGTMKVTVLYQTVDM